MVAHRPCHLQINICIFHDAKDVAFLIVLVLGVQYDWRGIDPKIGFSISKIKLFTLLPYIAGLIDPCLLNILFERKFHPLFIPRI